MIYYAYRIETIPEAEDIVSAILSDCGISGVEIEDCVPLSEEELAQMFVDIPLVGDGDRGKAYVTFYLTDEDDREALLGTVMDALSRMAEFMDLGSLTVTQDETEDADWINNWKEHFHQFAIDDVLIIPSWEDVEPKDADKMVIHIDPGTAFGTGKHETTRSCIRALKANIHGGEKVLDIGTGSGILMMLAVKFGAAYGVGTDLDPCALPAVSENLANNAVTETQYEMHLGNVITDEALCKKLGYGTYDVVVANILAEVLLPLTPVAVKMLKPGGIYITSGIIDFKEAEVTEAILAAGMEIESVIHDGEWVCIISSYQKNR